MSGFASFVTAFCTVCVLTGGLFLICPSNKLENSVKYIFGLVFLLCILTSLPTFKDIRPKFDTKTHVTATDRLNEQASRWVFEAALKNADIEFSKIIVCTDKTEDGSIIINKVIVYSSAPPEAIQSILGGDDADYAVEVVNE